MTVENQTPVKERLLADIQKESDRRGRYPNPVSTLGKRYGLNNHDLQKNLFQLEKEGLIQVESGKGGGGEANLEIRRIRLRRGAMNEQLLKGHRHPISVADKVRQWILRAPQQKDGWVHVTPIQIREAIKVEGNTVSVAISNMQDRGEVEVRKQGQRIVAIRMVPKAGADPVKLKPAGNGATREQIVESTYEQPSVTVAVGDHTTNGPAPEMPDTPWLDRYLQARRFHAMAPADNPYLKTGFERNVLAEEAALLKAQLEAVLNAR